MNNKSLWLRDIACSLAIPAAVYIFFLILTHVLGIDGFGTLSDLLTILYTTTYSGLFALAVAINLTSGRFDFSVGATMLLAIILGGNISLHFGLTGIAFLLTTAVCGCIIGLISGLLYVSFRLPPMVISLGMAMIYEAVGFLMNNSEGVNMIGRADMLIYASFPINVILLVIVGALLTIILCYTQFGLNRRALATGQKNAVEVGINEKKNAVICYVIAGFLLGLAGCVYISKYGIVTPETGLSTSSYVMTVFLPIFISSTIERYCPLPVGVIIGAFTQACITSGFSRLGIRSSVQSVLSGILIMLLLAYTSNQNSFSTRKQHIAKLRLAEKAQTENEI